MDTVTLVDVVSDLDLFQMDEVLDDIKELIYREIMMGGTPVSCRMWCSAASLGQVLDQGDELVLPPPFRDPYFFRLMVNSAVDIGICGLIGLLDFYGLCSFPFCLGSPNWLLEVIFQ